jgi:hypothetical protein
MSKFMTSPHLQRKPILCLDRQSEDLNRELQGLFTGLVGWEELEIVYLDEVQGSLLFTMAPMLLERLGEVKGVEMIRYYAKLQRRLAEAEAEEAEYEAAESAKTTP